MQVEGTIFLRSFNSSSKYPFKCSRNTPFLSILQKGLEAFNLPAQDLPSNYFLRWQNINLDLCSCIQFSSIPFGSTLDICAKKQVSQGNHSIIKVCLQEMNSGFRSVLSFISSESSSPKLWQVLRVFQAVNLQKNSLQMDRKGFILCLESSGRLFKGQELIEVSLSQLGTNVLLRLSFQQSGTQVPSLPLLEGNDYEKFLHLEGARTPLKQQVESNYNNSNAKECNDKSSNAIEFNNCTANGFNNSNQIQANNSHQISPQSEPLHFELLDSLPHVETPTLPDSHYEFTVTELRELASQNALRQQQAENAPLASQKLASQKRERGLREKYPECKLRVRLPPGSHAAAVDTTFGSGEKIEALFGFLQGLKVDLQGWEFLVPNHASDLWTLRSLSFFDAGLYPAALVIAVAKKRADESSRK